MTNEVTTAKQTGLGALGALKSNLANVRAKMPEIASSPYLRLLQDGGWVFGQEDNSVAPGTEAVINVLSIKHGYSCWTNRGKGEGKNENLGEIMVGLSQALPAMHELEQKIDPQTERVCPWKDQMAVDVKFLDGKHKGTQVLYKVSSVGGLNAMKTVIDSVLEKLDEDTEFVCPVITLDSDSYKHPSYGKTYVPDIQIVGWMDLEGNEEDGDEGEKAAIEGPKPDADELAETARRQHREEQATEQEEPAPTRRRRRA